MLSEAAILGPELPVRYTVLQRTGWTFVCTRANEKSSAKRVEQPLDENQLFR